MTDDDMEILFGKAYGMFGDSNFTFQRLILAEICINSIPHFSQITNEKMEWIKIIYCLWQNVNTPNLSIFSLDDGVVKIKEYSHADDLSWNDVTKFLLVYIFQNTVGIGCKTFQESLTD